MSRTTRAITIAGAAVAAAISGFLLLQPSDDEGSPPSKTAVTTTTTTGATAPAAPRPARTVIRLKAGNPVGGMQKIEVGKGDVVRLRISSDTPDEIHVHGYDLEDEAEPGNPATFTFTADIEGRFEVESHTTETRIAELTVNPQD